MVQVTRYARGDTTAGAFDAGHQAPSAEKGITLTLPFWICANVMSHQATAADIEIIYDVCWMLSPMQIQRMCTNYYVADYEVRWFLASRTGAETLTESTRIRFRRRSSEWWPLEFKLTIAMTIFSCHQSRKK